MPSEQQQHDNQQALPFQPLEGISLLFNLQRQHRPHKGGHLDLTGQLKMLPRAHLLLQRCQRHGMDKVSLSQALQVRRGQ